MITAYLVQKKFKPDVITQENQELLAQAIWIDMLHPSEEERKLIEELMHFTFPTREEMQEIEPSSRLYKENDTVFMTVTMIAKSDSPEPKSEAVTLILKDDKFITLRYIEPQPFSFFISHLPRLPTDNIHSTHLVTTLLEAAIDRLADISERIGRHLDDYSQTIFRSQTTEKLKLDYKQLLQDLGLNGDLNAKAWESLVSFNRMSVFFSQVMAVKFDEGIHLRMNMLTKDTAALKEQVKFLTSKITFLLDATLGMVNIEQNNIIKIFSLAAVIFLPPTLIASIYGMNFHMIPGIGWRYGYLMSFLLMLLSGWLPYKFFKLKKWL